MKSEILKLESYLIYLRRLFHEFPELSGNEYNTQLRIIDELENLNIKYKRAGKTSVVAEIDTQREGKTLAIRADMDALPINEDNDYDFKSKNKGLMHACGHDAHMAILLGTIKILNQYKSQMNGKIKFLFQDSEEVGAGAKKLIEEGYLEDVDACIALHQDPLVNTGEIHIAKGKATAATDSVTISFFGECGHTSTPYLAKDTIIPACSFVNGLQNIILEKIDNQSQYVVVCSKFQSGIRGNIISPKTDVELSIRYFDEETRKKLVSEIKKYANSIAEFYEIKVEVEDTFGCSCTVNDDDIREKLKEASIKILGSENVIDSKPKMFSEDLSFIFEKVKGCVIILGSGKLKSERIKLNENKPIDDEYTHCLHSEKMKLNEECMKYGVAIFTEFALEFLKK
ncbi:MAG: amidohydrolase [Clostridioides sp.]|jgi:amidohydrolase|nr:amidohydrolase [Clostridioides sp.]